MIVVDYSRDGSNASALTAEDVAKLKVKPTTAGGSCCPISRSEKPRPTATIGNGTGVGSSGCSRRAGSIGKTRVARQLRRPLLAAGLAKIIFSGENSYLNRIINAGFEGVYLDKVDEFETLAKQDPNARRQIAFVKALAERARALKPGFSLCRRTVRVAHRGRLSRRDRRPRQGGSPVRRNQGQAAQQRQIDQENVARLKP
jgi:cysteinyl-tRNA synthetase